jgi:L-threonylcarbamoyladenylate synthase
MRIPFQAAVEALCQGQVVGVPTETVYGLAASLHHPQAISAIFSLKGRPQNNPLIIHCSSASQVMNYVEHAPPHFHNLADAFWPGPLTLVMPAKCSLVPPMARAGLPTAAFRIPSHVQAHSLIQHAGALVMPSANLSGRPSATTAAHVEQDFGDAFPVFDGGECEKGVESTILFWNGTEWELARLGALPAGLFEPILGYLPLDQNRGGQTPLCPGQLYRHYAPKAELRVMKKFPMDAEGVVIGFSDRVYPAKCRLIEISSLKEPELAARQLYAVLRQLDIEGVKNAYVDIDLPEQGLWLTIQERLTKAAYKSCSQLQ